MKLLAVSDAVVKTLYQPAVADQYGHVDCVIGCGDLPYYYLEFLHSALISSRLLYVRGNHDEGVQYTSDGRALKEPAGGSDLHCRLEQVAGYSFAGLEGSMRYKSGAPMMYTEREMRRQVLKLAPQLALHQLRNNQPLDFLITHSPPFEIHDMTDRAHTGFRIFRTLIERFRPRFLLHGHVHDHRSNRPKITRYCDTLVINVYPYFYLDTDHPPEPDVILN